MTAAMERVDVQITYADAFGDGWLEAFYADEVTA